MRLSNLLEIPDLRGGRNGFDSPRSLPENQAVEALNVDFYQGTLGRRRGGAAALVVTGAGFTGVLSALFRHLPSSDLTAAEVWGVDSAFKVGRYSGGAWSSIAPTDAITANAPDIAFASLNGKMFIAHKSAKDRLHVWDGTTLRRVGLAAPTAAPTNVLAAGAVSDTRKYKSAVTVQAAGVTLRRSELSAASGSTVLSAQQATNTLAGAPGEGETHWELYAASTSDGFANYWLIGTAAIGGTIADNSAVASTATGVVSNSIGTYTVPWSAKYVCADLNRLVFAGSYEQTPLASRVGFTPVIGASNVSDDERVPSTIAQSNYIDLDVGDGGGITGLASVNNSVYAFKVSQLYKLVRTGTASTPYDPVTVSKSVGALRHQTICAGEDENGNPCLYFLSREGPYRVGPRGLEYLGNDVRDVWTTVNLAATTAIGHGVYYPSLHQVWWWIATGAANEPDTRIVFDVRKGVASVGGTRQGWVKHTGESCKARCSAMLPLTFGATQTIALAPHIGYSQTNAALWRGDTADLTDNGTAFQAYILTKPYAISQLGRDSGVDRIYLLAVASATSVISCSVVRDFGLETRVFSASLTPAAAETRVLRTFEDAFMATAGTLQFQFGDSAAASVPQWVLDGLAVQLTLEETKR